MVKRVRHLRLAIQTARCAVLLRRRGVRAGLVTCEGRLPVVHTGGRARIGRLAVRGFTAPVELGAVDASLSITIGDDVRIGDHVGVYDSDHHPIEQGADARRAPVAIGRNAWLARGAIVLPGVTIGEHAVVAAGAVVTGDVPARSLAAGNPARVVRTLRADEGWRRP